MQDHVSKIPQTPTTDAWVASTVDLDRGLWSSSRRAGANMTYSECVARLVFINSSSSSSSCCSFCSSSCRSSCSVPPSGEGDAPKDVKAKIVELASESRLFSELPRMTPDDSMAPVGFEKEVLHRLQTDKILRLYREYRSRVADDSGDSSSSDVDDYVELRANSELEEGWLCMSHSLMNMMSSDEKEEEKEEEQSRELSSPEPSPCSSENNLNPLCSSCSKGLANPSCLFSLEDVLCTRCSYSSNYFRSTLNIGGFLTSTSCEGHLEHTDGPCLDCLTEEEYRAGNQYLLAHEEQEYRAKSYSHSF